MPARLRAVSMAWMRLPIRAGTPCASSDVVRGEGVVELAEDGGLGHVQRARQERGDPLPDRLVARGVFPAICGGSAITLSSCTVIARIVPSAVVMVPRSAGMRMICSL